jgi:hypothetical protein
MPLYYIIVERPNTIRVVLICCERRDADECHRHDDALAVEGSFTHFGCHIKSYVLPTHCVENVASEK